MSFATVETSRQLGAPFALILFTYGPGATDVYAYTTSEDPVIRDSITYEPVPIHHDSFSSSGSLDRSAFEVKLSKFLAVADLFNGFPPSYEITLKLWLGHVGETEYKPVWFGKVLSHRVEGDELIFTCEPVSSSLRRSGLRRNYQRGCPHALYGDRCQASRAAFTTALPVQFVASPVVTLPVNWNGSLDTSKYVGGPAWWVDADGRTQYRSILRISTDTAVQLNGDCSTLTTGMTLNVAPGCNHQMSDCTTLFHNINNYGGQPWIPLKNPLGIINNFV